MFLKGISWILSYSGGNNLLNCDRKLSRFASICLKRQISYTRTIRMSSPGERSEVTCGDIVGKHAEGEISPEGDCKIETPASTTDGSSTQLESAAGPAEGTLSKRAQKRIRRWEKIRKDREKKGTKKKDYAIDSCPNKFEEETSYYFENGLRKVRPYYFPFHTFCKQRWIGQSLREVFTREFRRITDEEFESNVKSGLLRVNDERITSDYILKDNDRIENVVHRHESHVTDQPLAIVEEDDDVLVVNKPSSIPIHPCGRFRHNSVLFILAREQKYHNLRTLYRLDRLTSGLLIIGKSERLTAKIMKDIKDRNVVKEYICKVEGEFPSETVVCEEPIDTFFKQAGIQYVNEKGKHAKTTFDRLSTDGKTSIVKCQPHTGRTHQIRVHLQYVGYPITNDPMYNSLIWGPNKGKGGKYERTHEEIMEDMILNHNSELYLDKIDPATGRKMEDGDEGKTEAPGDVSREDEAPESKKLKLDCDSAEPAAEDGRPGVIKDKDGYVTFDPNCSMCKLRFRDPTPEELVMYLHAYRYKGSDWEYSTPLPQWAEQND